MIANINKPDKIIRILIAVVILVLSLTHVISGGWEIALLIFGAAMLITAFINFCPVYHFLHISTRRKKADQ
ncbi:MAG: DUF2892 domain-containing protein [Chitinophagaceae bacterium]|nr:DUF2892 domain-containing protein [Chitinophagaceae bacterium]